MTDREPSPPVSTTERESARSLVFMVITLGVLGIVTHQVWLRFRVPSGARLTADRIVAQPAPPSWIRSDLVQDVMIQGSLSNRTLGEPGLVRAVHRAFTNHSWVKKVRFAAVENSGKVLVELDYRRPFAALSVRSHQVPVEGGGEKGLLVIDDEGVCLENVSEAEALQLPMIYAEDATAPEHYGVPWNDKRIRQSVDIIAALGTAWNSLRLHSVTAPSIGRNVDHDPQLVYELHTVDRHRIVWGSAPGSEPPLETPAAQKVSYLISMAGALRSAPAPSGDEVWADLRTRQSAGAGPTASRRRQEARVDR